MHGSVAAGAVCTDGSNRAASRSPATSPLGESEAFPRVWGLRCYRPLLENLRSAFPVRTSPLTWGILDFRVGRKVFATLGYPDIRWAMVKLPLQQQALFVRSHPEVFTAWKNVAPASLVAQQPVERAK